MYINHHLRKVLDGRSHTIDFQRSRVYQHHIDLNETVHGTIKANRTVKLLDSLWKISTTPLYPKVWNVDYSEGWTLAPRKGAIQIPRSMLSPCYIAHEHAHCVVESYRVYYKKDLYDAGHGPLWAGVYALNISEMMGDCIHDILKSLKEYDILTLDVPEIYQFHTFFKSLKNP